MSYLKSVLVTIVKTRWDASDMKRYNNLFDKIVSLDNLYLADKKARRNKSHRKDIIEFDKNKAELLLQL
nr:MAG: hypothetical protein [Bacteriophage sp.]